MLNKLNRIPNKILFSKVWNLEKKLFKYLLFTDPKINERGFDLNIISSILTALCFPLVWAGTARLIEEHSKLISVLDMRLAILSVVSPIIIISVTGIIFKNKICSYYDRLQDVNNLNQTYIYHEFAAVPFFFIRPILLVLTLFNIALYCLIILKQNKWSLSALESLIDDNHNVLSVSEQILIINNYKDIQKLAAGFKNTSINKLICIEKFYLQILELKFKTPSMVFDDYCLVEWIESYSIEYQDFGKSAIITGLDNQKKHYYSRLIIDNIAFGDNVDFTKLENPHVNVQARLKNAIEFFAIARKLRAINEFFVIHRYLTKKLLNTKNEASIVNNILQYHDVSIRGQSTSLKYDELITLFRGYKSKARLKLS